MSSLISLQKISFNYDDQMLVLRELDLDIHSKDKILITGKSGSGKTTLLHIIGRLLLPVSGGIIGGCKISFIFQMHHLIESLTAVENVALALAIEGMDWAKAIEKAEEMLSVLELTERLNHFPSQLSGGEKQRVAIARALIVRPDLILCDEPTGSLDQSRSQVVLGLILALAEKFGTGIVMISHDRSIKDNFDVNYELVNGILVKN